MVEETDEDRREGARDVSPEEKAAGVGLRCPEYDRRRGESPVGFGCCCSSPGGVWFFRHLDLCRCDFTANRWFFDLILWASLLMKRYFLPGDLTNEFMDHNEHPRVCLNVHGERDKELETRQTLVDGTLNDHSYK